MSHKRGFVFAASFNNIRADLSQLILSPDNNSNSLNVDSKEVTDLSISVRYTSKSSANADRVCDDACISMGVTICFSLRYCASGSSDRIYHVGESPHPCLVPLKILKALECKPLVDTIAEGLAYSVRIIFIKFTPFQY